MSWISDVTSLLRGLQRVNRALSNLRQRELQYFWQNSSIRVAAKYTGNRAEEFVSDVISKQSRFEVLYIHKYRYRPTCTGIQCYWGWLLFSICTSVFTRLTEVTVQKWQSYEHLSKALNSKKYFVITTNCLIA